MREVAPQTVPVQGQANPAENLTTMYDKLLKPSESVPPGCPSVCTLRRLTRCGLVASGSAVIGGATAMILAATMNLSEGTKIGGYMGGGLLIMSGLTGLCNLLIHELGFNHYEETMKSYFNSGASACG